MEFPLTFGVQKTGLPLIVTSGKLKNMCFLIDTGSTHNTLFDFVYEHFKDEFKLLDNSGILVPLLAHDGTAYSGGLVPCAFSSRPKA